MSRRRLPALKLLTIAILAVFPVLSAQADPQQQDRGREARSDQRRAEEHPDGIYRHEAPGVSRLRG